MANKGLREWTRQITARAKPPFDRFMQRLSDASLELLLLLFPVALSSIPHAFAGKFNAFANGPDVLMFCAILFADGWWKVRARKNLDEQAKATLEVFGLIGTTVGSMLAMVTYFDQLKLLTASIDSNDFFSHARTYFFHISFIYAIWVRVRPDAAPNTPAT